MKNYKQYKMIAVLASIGLAAAFIGNACSGFKSGENGSTDAHSMNQNGPGYNNLPSQDAALACTTQADFIAVPGATTTSIKKADTLLQNLLSCVAFSGITENNISQTTKDTYNARKASLSPKGYVGDVTAGMMMSLAAISVEFCNDIVNFEAAQTPTTRAFFRNVDFNATSMTSAEIGASLNAVAGACWGDFAAAEDTTIIVEELAAMGAISNKVRAIAICTSAMSSLNGLKAAQ